MFLSIFYFWLTLSLLGVSSANLVIHSNEMTPEMSDHVIVTALKATEVLPEFDDIAKKMIECCNEKYGQNWQCIVSNGKIGLDVSHLKGTFISFTILKTNIILFKTKLISDSCLKISGLRDRPGGTNNFCIEVNSPVKIVSNPCNGTNGPIAHVHPIVVGCISRNDASRYDLSILANCVKSTFEAKFNESGWTCAAGLNKDFDAKSNKSLRLHYSMPSLYIRLFK